MCYNVGMKVKAYAKLNLTLNVLGKSGNFHQIDSIVTTVDVFDEVQVTLRKDKKVRFDCDLADCPVFLNSAYRAAVAFRAETGVGCNVAIKKHIPVGAGMGGSSADAAAVLFCLQKLTSVSHEVVFEIAKSVGSDVNALLCGGFCRMRGKGDDVTKIASNLQLDFAVIRLGSPVSAGQAYAYWDELGSKPQAADCDSIMQLLQAGDCSAIHGFSNNLQVGVCNRLEDYPRLADVCKTHGLPLCMTGSGNCFYVPCVSKTDASNAAKLLTSSGFSTFVCASTDVGVIRV